MKYQLTKPSENSRKRTLRVPRRTCFSCKLEDQTEIRVVPLAYLCELLFSTRPSRTTPTDVWFVRDTKRQLTKCSTNSREKHDCKAKPASFHDNG